MPLSSSEEFTERELSRDDEYPNKTPIEEVMEICRSDDEISGKSTVIAESSKSNVVNDNMMKDSTSSCDNETCESHNIL